MLLPKRHGAVDSYRYGFNGKEKDDEVKGEGLHIDYGYRILDPRLGRFLSIDPLFKGFPYYTPYQYASNTPIVAIDLDGLESDVQLNENEMRTKFSFDLNNKFTQFFDDLFAFDRANSQEELDRAYEKQTAAIKKLDAMLTFTNSLATTTKQAADFILPVELYENLATGKNLDGTDAQWYDYVINVVGVIPGGKLAKGVKIAGKYGDEFFDVTELIIQKFDDVAKRFDGGMYGKTDGKGITGFEKHHMPANAISPLSRYKGGAIQINPKDHKLTGSWGNSKSSQNYRKKQKAYIDSGNFGAAFEMDVKDIRSKFGDKYDGAIEQAREYYIEEGLIKK
jgi:RHS repeat-associated protein